MKKEVVLTIRVDAETGEAMRAIAREDERTAARVARKLITEALVERGALSSSVGKVNHKDKTGGG